MTSTLRNALLIHNPNAGNAGKRRRPKLDEARKILAAGGIEAELAETKGPNDATEIARRANAEGRDLIIACGGDGTLNEVVNGLAESQNGHRAALALLPGGTANILAKELGIPWDIVAAARKILTSEIKEIALGLATPINQPEKRRYFMSVAGAGPDGMIVYSIDLDLKAKIGILAYWYQGFREVLRYKFQHFRVIVAGQNIDSSLAVIGRTQNYGGPFKITTRADLFEDQFEVLALTTRSGFRYLSYLGPLYFNKLRGKKNIHFHKTDTVLCEPINNQTVYAQIDGEAFARLPVEFKIVPKSLKLLVPTK